MNFSWTKAMLLGAVIATAIAFPGTAVASRLLTENFEYPAGNLCGQGRWYYLGTQAEAPIQLSGSGLSLAGYQPTPTGCTATITHSTNQDQDLAVTWETPVTSGTLYASALINVSEVNDDVYFLSFGGAGAAGYTQGKAISWEGARIFACKGDTDGHYKLGFSKNAAAASFKSDDLPLGQTILVVIGLEVVEGNTNDIVSLWINPTTGADTPAAADASATVGADQNASRGVGALQLRQGSTASKTGPTLTIDAIRVADTWADLWNGGGTDPDPGPNPGTATITAPESLDFGALLQYATTTQTVRIKATGLTENISVSSSTADVKPSVTSIPMEDAMSETGYTLTLTYKASAATLSGSLSLSSAGAETVSIPLSATVQPVSVFANFRQIDNLNPENVYLFQGKATVTHIDLTNSRLYAQDIYGGGAVFDLSMLSLPLSLKKGDRFTNAYCFPGETEQGVRPLYLYDAVAPSVTASDVDVEALEITFAELARNPEDYINRLVTVADVDFGSAAGQNFTTAGVSVTTGSGDTGRVRAFAGSDLLGTAIPTRATSVTGISTSAAAAVVTMRSAEDLVAAADPVDEPALEVEREMLMDANEYQEIGKTVRFGRLTVSYTNLPSPATIWLGGKDRAMFSLDKEEIPAGSGTVEIIISYTPTTTGRHTATVNFDATPTHLSQTISMSARAFDPAVTPTISVNSDNLTEFTADVNGSVQQTVTYTTANLLDYGNVRVAGTSNGAFRISTATMLMNGTGNVVITFNPKSEGTFTEQIIFSADKAEPVTLTVNGRTSGAPLPPAEKEGDEFTMASFDTSAPRALVVEDFQNCGQSNKPLHIDGWTNAAVTGTRAWWAYKELDSDNMTAKVTAYDSKALESTDASMLLLSPALDFNGAKQQLLAFRVKGRMMTASMFDNLQVIYIDPVTEEIQTLDAQPVATSSPLDNVWAEAIQGLNLPASADYNDQWCDYVIDLKGQDLAPVFFIGFGYTSLRGTETTVQYFIDDFSWGRDDLSFIRPSLQWLDMETIAGTDNYSDPISVEGLNLSGPVTLKVTGANASKFKVEPTQLPAEGGEFRIRFNSDEIGVHSAYIELSADGAPLSLISVEANNTVDAAIALPGADQDLTVDIYNLQGILIRQGVNPVEAIKTLPAGIYIIGGTKVMVK